MINLSDIQKMSVAERLQTMEALWESLQSGESDVESPEWHGEVLRERKRKIENGETEFISLEELKKRRYQ